MYIAQDYLTPDRSRTVLFHVGDRLEAVLTHVGVTGTPAATA